MYTRCLFGLRSHGHWSTGVVEKPRRRFGLSLKSLFFPERLLWRIFVCIYVCFAVRVCTWATMCLLYICTVFGISFNTLHLFKYIDQWYEYVRDVWPCAVFWQLHAMAAHSYNSTIFKAQLCMLIALHGSMDDDKNYIYQFIDHMNLNLQNSQLLMLFWGSGVFFLGWHMGCFSVGWKSGPEGASRLLAVGQCHAVRSVSAGFNLLAHLFRFSQITNNVMYLGTAVWIHFHVTNQWHFRFKWPEEISTPLLLWRQLGKKETSTDFFPGKIYSEAVAKLILLQLILELSRASKVASSIPFKNSYSN